MSTERSSRDRPRLGMGRVSGSRMPRWYGHRTAPRRTGPTASGRPAPDVRRSGCGTMGPATQTAPDSKERSHGRHPPCRGHLVRRRSPTGSGEVSAISSGAFSDLPVTWAARTETSDGKTSPEELVAAAHSSCFAMALSGALARAGHPAGAAGRLRRGHLRQARGGLAGRVERADRARRGPGHLRRRLRGGRRGDQGPAARSASP